MLSKSEDETNGIADDGDDVEEEVKAPKSREAEHSLKILKNYYLFSKNRGHQIMDILFGFENLVIKKSLEIMNSLLLMNSSAKIEKLFRYCNCAPFFPFSCTPKIYIETCLQGFK